VEGRTKEKAGKEGNKIAGGPNWEQKETNEKKSDQPGLGDTEEAHRWTKKGRGPQKSGSTKPGY